MMACCLDTNTLAVWKRTKRRGRGATIARHSAIWPGTAGKTRAVPTAQWNMTAGIAHQDRSQDARTAMNDTQQDRESVGVPSTRDGPQTSHPTIERQKNKILHGSAHQ